MQKKKILKKSGQVYPEVPNELINILEYVDGTYWREYAGEEIAFYFLGSDLDEKTIFFIIV